MAATAAEMPIRMADAQIGQVGQSAMGNVGGLVNGAAARFAELDMNGPGWMYYGINAADRGLGYRGSYYTVGGFIPYAEDDLGGLWSADVRGHLSNYGGFFSNVGAVRKQFWGGTIFGLGVYWDYDGDQNQYSPTTITDTSGSYVFAGGQSYQQVGVSGEWLTDYANLRTNGYIPCGNTGQLMGPFVGNSLLCQNGINAGLAGADGEVGVYLPGLADWAGMVSVGGYAFGNARYKTATGQSIVPYFGGVYTRLDLTLIKNWDFSLQANNDSFFDWTGFARLTYRMGGSRRRNVPDQMEQPMMRNEHIVRAHQVPTQAINQATGKPYQVFHVDNTATNLPTGKGTWENPFTTLTQAQTVATNPYDIVFVHIGNSVACPYEAPTGGYTFQADNQYLVGEGTALQLCTANCGNVSLWGTTPSALYPIIAPDHLDATGVAINLQGPHTNVTVDHLRITNAKVGISDGVGRDAGTVASVNDVQIYGSGPGQRGVYLGKSDGATLNFSSMNLQNLTNDGFFVQGSGTNGPIVNIAKSVINNTSGSGVVANDVGGSSSRVKITGSTITKASAAGVYVADSNAYVGTSTINQNALAGVYVQDSTFVTSGTGPAGVSTVQVDNSSFRDNAVGIWAVANSGTTNMTITTNKITTNAVPVGANGIILASGVQAPNGSGIYTGVLNAVVVGNTITPTIATQSTKSLSTSTTTGSGTSAATTTSSVPVTQFKSVGNILIQTSGSLQLSSGTTGTVTGFVPYGTMNIKALDQVQLESMNNAAGVATMPLPVVISTGSSLNTVYLIPPPPTFDASLTVPLPAP